VVTAALFLGKNRLTMTAAGKENLAKDAPAKLRAVKVS